MVSPVVSDNPHTFATFAGPPPFLGAAVTFLPAFFDGAYSDDVGRKAMPGVYLTYHDVSSDSISFSIFLCVSSK